MTQQLLARLGEGDRFAQPVQKATLQFVLESLDGVADGRLREMQFPRSLGERPGARERDKSAQLSAIQRYVHVSLPIDFIRRHLICNVFFATHIADGKPVAKVVA